MEKAVIRNLTKENIILTEAEIRDNFFTRFRGLLGRKYLKEDTGIILNPCNSIHMIGMRFSIDVIFVDRNNQVCHLISPIKPMHISPMIKNAKYVIEAPVGTIRLKNIELNDKVEIVEKLISCN